MNCSKEYLGNCSLNKNECWRLENPPVESSTSVLVALSSVALFLGCLWVVALVQVCQTVHKRCEERTGCGSARQWDQKIAEERKEIYSRDLKIYAAYEKYVELGGNRSFDGAIGSRPKGAKSDMECLVDNIVWLYDRVVGFEKSPKGGTEPQQEAKATNLTPLLL